MQCVTNVTRTAALALVVAALVAASTAAAGPSRTVRCATLVNISWTSTVDGRITHGRRYRVDADRLPCFVAVRLAEQLIPLRTSAAFAERRPIGYICIPLGTGTNRYRPATAVGLCLQKPVGRAPERSFSWRPVPRT
jgi:hypothetical protein